LLNSVRWRHHQRSVFEESNHGEGASIVKGSELIIDSFAGGGGASLGIEKALGRSPDVAINHDAAAITMHTANHPDTKHYTEDVWKVSPRSVTRGRRVGLLWASPDCKHFSRAKGGKPVQKSIRSLAWVVVKWAVEAKPRVIILENVREFEDWGPLLPMWQCQGCEWKGTEGQAVLARKKRRCPRCDSANLRETDKQIPDPDRKGLTFRRWAGRLRNLGYTVEWKTLNAADYGAPTHRRRLFLVARRDGRPIVWPEPTHGDPKKIAAAAGGLFGCDLLPWRTAAECIDWSIPCPSIFDRKKPLAEKTLRRIALGIKRYVLDNPRPFLVSVAHTGTTGRGTYEDSIDEPLKTITKSNDKAVISPVVVPLTHAGERRANGPQEPFPTVTGARRGEHALISPTLARIGQTGGNGKYANGVDEPLTTITSKAEHVVVAPTLIQAAYGAKGRWGDGTQDLAKPLGTIHAGGGNYAIASPILVGVGGAEYAGKPRPMDEPAGTVLPHDRRAVCAAFLAKHFGGMVGVPVDTPLPTTTARGTQNQVVAANLIHLNRNTNPTAADEPLNTVTSGGGHAALVYSFLTKYFGTAIGTVIDAPLHTATSKDRFGLVTVTIDGQPYVIVDIGMRMLSPRELARAQGFPDSAILTGTKTAQVERIGNSVCPQVAEAMARVNCAAEAEAVSA
jgi:DNA (cytosine-5)-methyltransferase 1